MAQEAKLIVTAVTRNGTLRMVSQLGTFEELEAVLDAQQASEERIHNTVKRYDKWELAVTDRYATHIYRVEPA